jgi:hypothetical protein
MKVLTKNEAALLRALAQCFLPSGGGIDADAIDAGVIPRMDAWMSRLRPMELVRVRALFQLFEYYIAVEQMRPLARFTKASQEERVAYLSSWEHSAVYARRLAFQGVRSMITLAYDQSAQVRAQMGTDLESEEAAAAQAKRLAEAAEMLTGQKGSMKRVG